MTVRYTVVLSKIAQEKFNRFIRADRKLGEQLAKAIERLAVHPELGEFLKGEWKGYRKYRTGSAALSTASSTPTSSSISSPSMITRMSTLVALRHDAPAVASEVE